MLEKIKQLEVFISQLFARQKDLEERNRLLQQRLRSLESDSLKLKTVETQLKELREWKRNTQTVLRRISSRLEKEIEKVRDEEKIV